MSHKHIQYVLKKDIFQLIIQNNHYIVNKLVNSYVLCSNFCVSKENWTTAYKYNLELTLPFTHSSPWNL